MMLGKKLRQLLRDTDGASAIEYAFLCSLIMLAIVGAVSGVANETIDMWDFVRTKVTSS